MASFCYICNIKLNKSIMSYINLKRGTEAFDKVINHPGWVNQNGKPVENLDAKKYLKTIMWDRKNNFHLFATSGYWYDLVLTPVPEEILTLIEKLIKS